MRNFKLARIEHHKENQFKNEKITDSEKPVAPPKDIFDAAIQTVSLERKDVENQANIPRKSNKIAIQTKPEEISLPAKKRKLSSISASFETSMHHDKIKLSLPIQSIPSRSEYQMNNEQAVLDDAILNSEVYKIYCREKDPKEALEQIRQLKTCHLAKEPKRPFPVEKDLKRACQTFLDELWSRENKSFSQSDIMEHFIKGKLIFSKDALVLQKALNDCFTRIITLQPNGWFEYWLVANFDKGPGLSKWYRGESSKREEAARLIILNFVGINDAILQSQSILQYMFAPMKELVTVSAIEITAFVQCQYEINGEWKVNKCYEGKSVRRVTRKQKSEEVLQEHKEEMTKEAKKAALNEFFRDRLGLTV